MKMSDYLPHFRNFIQTQVLDRGFDFIVPVESKGMLLLQQVMECKTRQNVLNRRAFDFIAPRILRGKTAAIIDDTVFTGKTLRDTTKELIARGLDRVERFGFLLHELPFEEAGTLEDVTICEKISHQDYKLIADELSRLASRVRPSYPDHLTFRVSFPSRTPWAHLEELCMDRGTLVEYCRSADSLHWSVHFAQWSPLNNDLTTPSGLDKLRISGPASGSYVDVTPIVFPEVTLEALDQHVKHNPSAKSFCELLARDWHDDKVKRINHYEAFTLDLRMRTIRNFLTDLRGEGLLPHVHFYTGGLQHYFGPTLAQSLHGLVMNELAVSSPHRQTVIRSSPLDLNPSQVLQNEIVHRLKAAYIEKNVGRPRAEWESVGLTIEEIAVRADTSLESTALACEALNDQGHLSPIPFDYVETGRRIRRSYRLTETATARITEQGD